MSFKKFFVLISLFLLILNGKSIYAACSNGKCDSTDEYPAYIEELSNKKNELSNSKNTLANQIKLLDSQYQLTLTKITQTENSIKSKEVEIENQKKWYFITRKRN
jgi:peptidoglycan hydrolase CwlO-like protein